MNIVKLQDDLKNVPDQTLVGYVQNPSGQVPTYLALSELQRRKKMREQAGSANPQAAQPSVAEQLVAETQPPMQGIAALPVPDEMYSAAEGGIVGYEEGGEVKHYQLGGRSYLDPLYKMTPLGGLYSGVRNVMDIAGGETAPGIADVLRTTAKKVGETEADYLNRVSALTGIPIPTLKESTTEKAQVTPALVGKTTPAKVDNAYIDKLTKPEVPVSPVPQAAPRAAPMSAPATAPQAAAPTRDFSGLNWTDLPDKSNLFDEIRRPARTVDEIIAERQALVGENEGLAALKQRLAGMETKAAKEEERAPWMALAEAGLGMAAGSSPFALQNIAVGGMRGVQALERAKERLADKEEKRFNIQSQLAQAERAEKVATADYGLRSREAEQAREETNRLNKLNYQTNREVANAKGKFESAAAKVNAELKTQELDEARRYHDLWYKTNMEKARKDEIALDKSIRSNETTQLKTLMSEAGDRLDKLLAAGVERTDPLYLSSLQIYNGAANALGLKTGVNTAPAQSGPRAKPLSVFGK